MRKIKCRPVAVHLIFFDDPYSLDFFTWFKSSVRKIKCRKIKCTRNQKSSVEKSSVTWFDEPYSFDFFRSVHLIFFPHLILFFWNQVYGTFKIKCIKISKSSVWITGNQVRRSCKIKCRKIKCHSIWRTLFTRFFPFRTPDFFFPHLILFFWKSSVRNVKNQVYQNFKIKCINYWKSGEEIV